MRLAIAQAIDADAIVKSLLHGVPKRFVRLDPGSLGYDPDLAFYPYDPAGAKKLLAEAGFAGGFPMTLYYQFGNWPGFKETAEAVVLYLRAVGINATAQAVDPGQANEMIRKVKTNQATSEFMMLYPSSMASLVDPTQNMQNQMQSRSTFSLFNNAEFDDVIERASHTMEDAARGALLKRAVKIIHDEIATIQLWNSAVVYSMKPGFSYSPIPDFPRMDLKMLSRN